MYLQEKIACALKKLELFNVSEVGDIASSFFKFLKSSEVGDIARIDSGL